MPRSYEDYEEEYNENISKIRRYLSQSRTATSLDQADRCLGEAKSCAHAMQALAEVAGDPLKIQDSKRRLFQEVGPLSKEITSSIKKYKSSPSHQPVSQSVTNDEYNEETNKLLSNSEQLLLESQALCADSEDTGTRTIQQMSIQREQLQITSDHINETISITKRARAVINEMRMRALKSKIFLYCIIGLLIVANGLAMHHLFHKNKK